jgi:N-acetylmuramic acid 6-phosphate etherase
MEERNQNTLDLDQCSTFEILQKINEEDKKIAYAVESQLPLIEKAVDGIVSRLKSRGRLFYIGSGTSGKIGVLDASECPPTFGVDEEVFQGIISGGMKAISGWLEETEDNEDLAVQDLSDKGITSRDVLVGLTASGNTPYVKRAMMYGKELGCFTVGIICRSEGSIQEICDLTITLDVGPEVIMGSTRMKAGTAQKMVANMISTTSMIKLGKTYSNLMVNVAPINQKLRNRVKEIVRQATDCNLLVIEEVLEQCEFDPRIAIVSIQLNTDTETAQKLLIENDWNVALTLYSNE